MRLRTQIAIAACVLGQASDILSTMAFRKLGIQEMNPLFRNMVAKKQWGKFIAVKAAIVTAGVFTYTLYRTPPKKRSFKIERAAWIAAWTGALAGAWNAGGILYYLWKRRTGLTNR